MVQTKQVYKYRYSNIRKYDWRNNNNELCKVILVVALSRVSDGWCAKICLNNVKHVKVVNARWRVSAQKNKWETRPRPRPPSLPLLNQATHVHNTLLKCVQSYRMKTNTSEVTACIVWRERKRWDWDWDSVLTVYQICNEYICINVLFIFHFSVGAVACMR